MRSSACRTTPRPVDETNLPNLVPYEDVELPFFEATQLQSLVSDPQSGTTGRFPFAAENGTAQVSLRHHGEPGPYSSVGSRHFPRPPCDVWWPPNWEADQRGCTNELVPRSATTVQPCAATRIAEPPLPQMKTPRPPKPR